MPPGLEQASPVMLAFLATMFTYGVTAVGAASVFFIRTYNQKVMDGLLGFAAGVMLAASYFSLLAPSIASAEAQGMIPWLPAVAGFLVGGFSIRLVDVILPHLHRGLPTEQAEGVPTHWTRTLLLALAITLHNIPEGLAVGVAFGAAGLGIPGATYAGATALAIGIGLQNFPEGIAVSVPLRREGLSRRRAFFWGQLTAAVEPIAGVIGAAMVLIMQPLLPFALAFAAGAMVFVVIEDVIPESQHAGHIDIAVTGAMLGFAVMMLLDVALG